MKKNLQQLFDEYIQECQYSSRMRMETLRGYKEVFRHFLAMMPHVTTAQSLSNEVMTEFFMLLQIRKRIVGKNTVKVGVKDSTIKTYWSKMNAFFKWLHAKSLIVVNPLSTIKPPQPVYDDQRALEREEIHKIISAITLHSNTSLILKRDMAMLSILVFCGLRRNELISLQIRDINIENRLLTVRAETSKSKKTRLIPMNPTLMLHLTEYLKELRKCGKRTQYLIVASNTDNGITKHGLKHWVNRLNILSGVKFHVHRFRHTFACNLAKQNVSAVKIQKLLGHADLRMTMTYLRSLTVEDLRDDVNRLCIADLV
jgi:integrase